MKKSPATPALHDISSYASIRKALVERRHVEAQVSEGHADGRMWFAAQPLVVHDVQTTRSGVMVLLDDGRWYRVGTWHDASLGEHSYRSVTVWAERAARAQRAR